MPSSYVKEDYSTGDAQLDKLLTAHVNAAFDCGDWREPGEDSLQDEDRKYHRYEDAMEAASKTRKALYDYIRTALGKSAVTGESK